MVYSHRHRNWSILARIRRRSILLSLLRPMIGRAIIPPPRDERVSGIRVRRRPDFDATIRAGGNEVPLGFVSRAGEQRERPDGIRVPDEGIIFQFRVVWRISVVFGGWQVPHANTRVEGTAKHFATARGNGETGHGREMASESDLRLEFIAEAKRRVSAGDVKNSQLTDRPTCLLNAKP